jgi:hypothetical protein
MKYTHFEESKNYKILFKYGFNYPAARNPVIDDPIITDVHIILFEHISSSLLENYYLYLLSIPTIANKNSFTQ